MAKHSSKEEDDDKDDKFDKMDDESLSFLEQVRKGKSRNFVLSMKGNKVRSMVVEKKPIKEKDRKAARGEGFQPIYGVASGMGAKITFTIARADGFDEKAADRKTEKLKKFLSSQTGKVFKPDFELVDAPPPIPFDEEDLNDPLIAKFMKMEPVIAKACDTHPDSIPLIQTSVNMIRGLLQDDETRQDAGPKIAEFIQYLKDLMSGGAAVPPAPPLPGSVPPVAPPAPDTPEAADQAPAGAAPPPPPPQEGAKKLADALKQLKPLVDKVINADPNRKTELHTRMAEIAGEIKAKQFVEAKKNIIAFADELKTLAAQTSTSTTGDETAAPDNRAMEFAKRRDDLESRLLDAQRADREIATKLGAVWNYANEQAQAENFENALKALDRLGTAIDGVLAGAQSERGSEKPAIDWEQARSAWQDASDDVDRDIAKLQGVLRQSGDDELVEIAEFGLNALTGNFKVPLLAAIREIDAGSGDARIKAARKALTVITDFRKHIVNSEQVTAVDDNPFGVNLAVRKTLLEAFAKLEASLQPMVAN